MKFLLIILSLNLNALAQTYVHKNPELEKKNKEAEQMELDIDRAIQVWKACTDELSILEKNRTAQVQARYEISKKILKYCYDGCTDDMKKYLNHDFNIKTLKKNDINEEQAISGWQSSCQIMYSKYRANRANINASTEKLILDSAFKCTVVEHQHKVNLIKDAIDLKKIECDKLEKDRHTIISNYSKLLDEIDATSRVKACNK